MSIHRLPLSWLIALTLAGPAAGADELTSIAVEAGGSLVVVDRSADSIRRVDPQTGAVTTVSSDTVGAGMSLDGPMDVAVEPAGSLLVTVPGQFTIDGQERLVRVDAESGDRTTLSDASTGGGTVLHAPQDVAVADDGRVYVREDPFGTPNPARVVQVDRLTGDRTAVCEDPALTRASGLAVEPSGTLVSTVSPTFGTGSVVRIDPATGELTTVSDADAGIGAGPPMNPYAVDVGAGGTLAVLDGGREIFCFLFCPGEICVACIEAWVSVMTVDPATGDRRRISGGGFVLETVGGVLVPPLGARGGGPAFSDPRDLAVESGKSVVVVDDGRVMRVNRITGRRSLLATVDSGAKAPAVPARPGLAERARALAAQDPRRVYRPRHPRAWLRDALGTTGAVRPAELLARLSTGGSSTAAQRLYDAMWRAMREVLGANHPDALESAPVACRD
jgi:hypothetical protein